jgi:hypothetical protein
MTNAGFITGCIILSIAILVAGYYINRAILAAGAWIQNAIKMRK